MITTEGISVMLPAYNEEDNIKEVVLEALRVMPKVTKDYEIVIIDDGSKDVTGRMADSLAKKYKRVSVIHHKSNQGFAGVRKTAYASAKKNLIFFAPTDGQVDLSEITKFVEKIKTCDAVVSYRIKRPESINRIIVSGIFHFFLRHVFGLPIKEMSACIMHKRKLVKDIKLESNSAFVEAEVLYKLHRKGYKIGEVPIHYFSRKAGKSRGNKLSVILKTCFDLLRLGIKLRFNSDSQ